MSLYAVPQRNLPPMGYLVLHSRDGVIQRKLAGFHQTQSSYGHHGLSDAENWKLSTAAQMISFRQCAKTALTDPFPLSLNHRGADTQHPCLRRNPLESILESLVSKPLSQELTPLPQLMT